MRSDSSTPTDYRRQSRSRLGRRASSPSAEAGIASAKQPARSIAPRSVPPPSRPRSNPSGPAASREAVGQASSQENASVPPPQSTPRHSLRPVSVAPRPASSSPSSERPKRSRRELTGSDACHSSVFAGCAGAARQRPSSRSCAAAWELRRRPVAVLVQPEMDAAVAAAAVLFTDVALRQAPAAIMTSNALEVMLSPASVPAEWPDTASRHTAPQSDGRAARNFGRCVSRAKAVEGIARQRHRRLRRPDLACRQLDHF